MRTYPLILLALLSGCATLAGVDLGVAINEEGRPEVRIALDEARDALTVPEPLVEAQPLGPPTDEAAPRCMRIGEAIGPVRFRNFTPGTPFELRLDPSQYGAFDQAGNLLPLPLQGDAALAFGCRYRLCVPGSPGDGGPDPAFHGGGALRENTTEGRYLRRLARHPGNPLGLPCPTCPVCQVDDLDSRRVFPNISNWIFEVHDQTFGTQTPKRGQPPKFPPLEDDPPMPLEIAQEWLERCQDPGDRSCEAFVGCEIPNACRCWEHRPERVDPFSGNSPERLFFDPTRRACRPWDVVRDGGPVTVELPPEGWANPLPPEKWAYVSAPVEVEAASTATLTMRAFDPGAKSFPERAQVILFRLGMASGGVACEVTYRPPGGGHSPRLSVTGCESPGVVTFKRGEVLSLDETFDLGAGSYVLETGIRRPSGAYVQPGEEFFYSSQLIVETTPGPPPEPIPDICQERLEELLRLAEEVQEVCR